MNRIGRKKTVLVSFSFTLLGLLLPFIVYNFIFSILAFSLIGIGNTIIQVSLNPLVSNVVSKDKLTGSLTLGQFIKALASWLGPNVAAWLTATTLGWKYVFPVFAIITLVAAAWLWIMPIVGEERNNKSSSFIDTFSLLKDNKIMLFFIGILILVGLDVGLNVTLPKYLMERCPEVTTVSEADQLKSYFYFIVRAIGAFIGGILLMKVPENKFYTISVLLTFIGLIMILFVNALWAVLACIVLIALGYSNLFAIIFSKALQHLPQKANEVSSLLIVGVSGGILALLLGVVSDAFGSQWAAMSILVVMWLYVVWLIKPMNRN